MSEITKEITDRTAVRMTAKKGAACKWCHNPLPDAAAYNPTWPWKQTQGRGTVAFCGQNCMDWYNYKYRVNKLVGVMRLKHYSETEIDDRVQKLSRPTCPMPEVVGGLKNEFTTMIMMEDNPLQQYSDKRKKTMQINSSKYMEENNKAMDEQQNVTPAETAQEAPETVESEPAQAEAEEQKTQESASLNFEKRGLQVSAKKVEYVGQYVKLATTEDKGRMFVDLHSLAAWVDEEMSIELEQLLEIVKGALNNG